jgi:hypothetical protein
MSSSRSNPVACNWRSCPSANVYGPPASTTGGVEPGAGSVPLNCTSSRPTMLGEENELPLSTTPASIL